MVIANTDQLVNSMANNSSRIILDKSSIANAAAGQFHSFWRATGQPGQGAIPTGEAVCDNTLVGALQFTQQTPPSTSYLGIFESISSIAGVTIEIHDRLMHRGGLSGTVITAQTATVDISANLATSNLDARKGDANYSDVQWWLEWYADTGATSPNITVNVTYDTGSSGNLTTFAPGTSRRASFMYPLNSLIPSGGSFIRAVNTVTLSSTTGGAGNFGITATRFRGAMLLPAANSRFTATWADLGLPEIANSSCLFAIQIANSTSTGTLRGTGKIIHG